MSKLAYRIKQEEHRVDKVYFEVDS